MRDIQSRQIFWINAAWLGTMTLATVHGITAGWLGSFESLAAIAIGGMAISSAVAAILTRGILRPMRFRKDQVKPLLHFGARQMTASVIHTSVRQLDVALAQTFFGTAAVGVYQAAKTIFRFFELGLDAATSVVYPAAVTYHASGDCAALDTVTSKAISTLTVAYVAATAAVWSAGDAIGLVLGSRYAAAAGMLRTLSLASLVMPLGMTGVVLVAARCNRGSCTDNGSCSSGCVRMVFGERNPPAMGTVSCRHRCVLRSAWRWRLVGIPAPERRRPPIERPVADSSGWVAVSSETINSRGNSSRI